MKSCKYCQSEHTHKCGINKNGSQRYYCRECKRYYTPKPPPKAGVYPPEMHEKVAEMYVDGLNLRRIGRQMNINISTLSKQNFDILGALRSVFDGNVMMPAMS